MPGYEIDRFVDLTQNEKNELICSICQDILCCPVVTNCCLQSFCEECIKDWLNNNTTCPFDRKRLTTDQLSRAPRMVVNLLGQLRIRCDFRDNGCDEVICLEDLSNHSQQCQYRDQCIECEKCFCSDIKSNHDCVEYLLDINNQLKLNNEELKQEKENLLQTIAELRDELQCSSENYVKVLETVLTLIAKMKYNRNSAALLPLSEVLYLLVSDNKFKSHTTDDITRQVITKTLDILQLKCDETQVTINLMKVLLLFNIQEDIEFEYNRAVDTVVHNLDSEHIDESVLKLCFCLLYYLSHVKDKRHLIGNEMGMKTIIKHIGEKFVESGDSRELALPVWAILWNITDENAFACENFWKCGGFQCFSACYASLNTNNELRACLFGVLGNFAECPLLRHHLLDQSFIRIFMHHLECEESVKIEQCFTSGRILSQLLLIDEDVWKRRLPKMRADVLRLLNAAIPQWNIKTERIIEFNSFKPFEKILLCKQSPNESKLWVLWELANLTYVNASKYCPYLDENHLLESVSSFSKSKKYPSNMRSLALTVVQHYNNYKNK